MMIRALSLYLPQWAIDLHNRPRNLPRPRQSYGNASRGKGSAQASPLLLVATDHGQQWVAACCAAARRAGVHPGMNLAHARALLPTTDPRIEPFTPERDAQALHRLAAWVFARFTPLVAVDPPDGLLMDIHGCARLFRGEDGLASRLLSAVTRLGVQARIAVAPTYGGAWALARLTLDANRPIDIVGEHELLDRLRPLPVRALRIGGEIEATLREVGVERVGELLALHRDELARRFGPALLLRLDQATGGAFETIEPERPTPMPLVEREFDGPCVQVEAIELATRELIERLVLELQRRERGARRVELRLDRSDLPPLILGVTLTLPSRDLRHLWALIRPKLEKAQMGFGVDRLRLSAPRVGKLVHRQQGITGIETASESDDSAERAFGELVDQLLQRLGADRVTRVEHVATHLPERRYPHRPWSTGDSESPLHGGDSADASVEKNSGGGASGGASVLLERPEAIEVMSLHPDGPLMRMRWRGDDYAVVRSVGPQRTLLEWWKADAVDRSVIRGRDYFRVETESGRWLWVFRETGTSTWFIHGHWA